jgi:hypothetical protein
MGEITRFNPAALPAPTDLERIEIGSRKLTDIFRKSHDSGDVKSQRRLVADIEAAMETLPALKQQLASIMRQATKKELADNLSVLRIAFPNAKAAGDGFSRVLIERVAAKQPHYGALDWAVRQLIDHSNFMPTIAETLQALASAQERVDFAQVLSTRLPALRDEMAGRLAETQREEAAYPKRRAEPPA